MKELFFIACLVSSAILTSDSISPKPFPVNSNYQQCPSNGGVEINVLASSPNSWFCYQEVDYIINTTIISGNPTLFVSHFQAPQAYKTLTFTGTNTSIGEYNVWNYTFGYIFCQCGVFQQQLIIYDAVTYDVAGCMFLKFTLPCPSGNIGSAHGFYAGFNIYTVNIAPYPPLCREQTIEISGYLPGVQYNQSMQWVQIIQLFEDTSYTYYYYYNPYIFDFTPMVLNNITIKLPAPDSCKNDAAYQVQICIYGRACYAAWYYDVEATKKKEKSSSNYLNVLLYLITILFC